MSKQLEYVDLKSRVSLSQVILDSNPEATAIEMHLHLRDALNRLLSSKVYVRYGGKIICATCTGVMASSNPGGSISVEIPGVEGVVKIDPVDIMVDFFAKGANEPA